MRILYGTDRPAKTALNWEWVEKNCDSSLIARLRQHDPKAVPVRLLLEGADERRFFDVLENAIIIDPLARDTTFYQFADDFRTEDQQRYLARLDRLKPSSRSRSAPSWYLPYPPVYGDFLLHIYYREEHERLNKFMNLVSSPNAGKAYSKLGKLDDAGHSEQFPDEYALALTMVGMAYEDNDPILRDLKIRKILRTEIAKHYLGDPHPEARAPLTAEFDEISDDELFGNMHL